MRRIFDHNFIHKLDIWRENCLLSVPADIEDLPEPAFLFSSRLTWCNFAHLVHDTIIQSPTYQDACAQAGQDLTPMLVGPGFHYPVMAQVFQRPIRPIAKPPMFLRNRFYRVSRLFVPTTHFSPANHAIARGAVARLMGVLSSALAEYREPVKRRIFISREDSSRGDDREPRFVNSEELRLALGELGVEPLVVSGLGVEEYLRAFVNSELILGLHGAGITNAVLSESPRVLEITVPGYPDWHSLGCSSRRA